LTLLWGGPVGAHSLEKLSFHLFYNKLYLHTTSYSNTTQVFYIHVTVHRNKFLFNKTN